MSNKAPRTQPRDGKSEEPWFKARRDKNRKADKAARKARRKNRG